MDQNAQSGVNGNITDAITFGNLKAIAHEWTALAEGFLIDELVLLGTTGKLRQPNDPYFHQPGGLVEQWQALATAHRAAIENANRAGGVPDALLPSAHPQFDRFVLHFMVEALKAHKRRRPATTRRPRA